MARFLSIEERDGIERELEELGYWLDDLHEALNEMERVLRVDPDLTWMPRNERDVLSVVAADLLGAGFGGGSSGSNATRTASGWTARGWTRSCSGSGRCPATRSPGFPSPRQRPQPPP